ncbi:MAG: hypothetical protein IKS45_02710, partial [Thermoguttaceae bacterium]|nr:hypothetical protein [Thermoguttaceae bacterium]
SGSDRFSTFKSFSEASAIPVADFVRDPESFSAASQAFIGAEGKASHCRRGLFNNTRMFFSIIPLEFFRTCNYNKLYDMGCKKAL